MIDYPLKIAAMAMKYRIAVEGLIPHARNSIISCIAITKAVGHQQVHKVGSVYTLRKLAFRYRCVFF